MVYSLLNHLNPTTPRVYYRRTGGPWRSPSEPRRDFHDFDAERLTASLAHWPWSSWPAAPRLPARRPPSKAAADRRALGRSRRRSTPISRARFPRTTSRATSSTRSWCGDEGMRLTGSLAESWRLVSPTTYQFKLRRGVSSTTASRSTRRRSSSASTASSPTRSRGPRRRSARWSASRSSTSTRSNVVSKGPFPVLLARMTYAGSGSVVMLPPKYVTDEGRRLRGASHRHRSLQVRRVGQGRPRDAGGEPGLLAREAQGAARHLPLRPGDRDADRVRS